MDELLQVLESKIKNIIHRTHDLHQANHQLHQGKEAVRSEKEALQAKQQQAVRQIETLVSKLKAVENLI